MIQKINEVSPPGWGHTKAEKEKTKPNKPKSKIGGTADAMKKAQKRGDIPKNMNIFALMWSMKNKGDKPHYKPGVKDVLKKKYKGPKGQNEEKADEKPYPPTRLFKNVPNSVVKKANKEADKVKKEVEKAVLGEPPVKGPSGDSMHSKDNVYEDEKVDMVSLVQQAIQMKEFGLPPATVADKDLGNKINKAQDKEQKRRAKIDAKNIKVHGKLPYKKEGTEGDALVKAVAKSPKQQALKKKQMLSITSAGKKALKKGDQKLSITAKGRAAVEEVENEGWGAVAKFADSQAAAAKKKKETVANKKVSSWAKKEDMSLAPKGKGRKAAKALYKEGGIDEGPPTPKFKPLKHKVWSADASIPAGARPKNPGKIKKYKASGAMPETVTHFGDILRQAIEEAKKVDAIKEINKIVKTKTMGKLHGQKVDLFTASAIQQVYKAINHKNKEKMNSVMSKDIHGLLKMADFSMSKMKR